MAGEIKETMVSGAALLLAKKGLQATSFSEVLDLTGAPRGSVYHHFPEGKNQMITAALERAGQRALSFLELKAGSTPEELTSFFLGLWREVLVRSNFQAGCAVLAVTVAADAPELLSTAGTVFRSWRQRLAELLSAGGLDDLRSREFSALLIAACEGAVVLSRAEQSLEPFEAVSAQLLTHVASLAARP